jgi:hypothetical protein
MRTIRERKVIDDSETEEVPAQYAITSYGADFSVELIVQRLGKEIIFLPPFQRRFVWTLTQASQFIESLLLGLPVPGVFLSKEDKTGRLLIIDGQQRLRSIEFFVSGLFQGKEFALVNVHERFLGRTYKSLETQDRNNLNDAVIHATIIRQDEPSDDNQSSIYQIFRRLNSGGTVLQPQEIRACIYYGAFDDMLGELNKNKYWRSIYGLEAKRLKDQELILRFFAFYFTRSTYERPMKAFLNKFMNRRRDITPEKAQEFSELFGNTIEKIHSALGNAAFKPERVLNAAVFDSVMVTVAKSLTADHSLSDARLKSRYHELLKNDRFIFNTTRATGDKAAVDVRFEEAARLLA